MTYMDELFDAAREEAPRSPVEEVEKRLADTLVTGAALTSAPIWKGLFSLNNILMTAGVVTVITVGVVWATSEDERPLDVTHDTEMDDPAKMDHIRPMLVAQERTSDSLSLADEKQVLEPLANITEPLEEADDRMDEDKQKQELVTSRTAGSQVDEPSRSKVNDYTPNGRHGGHPNPTKKNEADNVGGEQIVSRILDQSTTAEQLNALFEELDKVGIRHELKEKNGRNVKRRLKLMMDGSTQTHSIRVEENDEWKIEFAWLQSAEGKALKFVSPFEEE